METRRRVDLLRRAIEQKGSVSAHYTPVRPGAIGQRLLEPHAPGVSRDGNLLLRAWVRSGVSHTNRRARAPDARWRLFRVDQLKSLVLDQPFKTRPLYNYDGDRAMARTIRRVPRPPNTRQRARR